MFSIRQKRIAAFVVFALFFGSTFAIAIDYAFSRGDQEEFTQPNKVSYSTISFNTKNNLIGNGYMIVSYERPSGCTSCDEEIREMITFVSDKADAFLVITNSTASDQKITMETYRGSKASNVTNLLETYCGLTYNTYDQCVIDKI